MVCNLHTLVCRYLILYFQHPTTVKNHLQFRTFLPKSLHNPNKCLTFAAPEPPSLLTMLKSGVVLFLYHYEIIQHPTTVKNHLQFRTFLPKSLHNPNTCLTFAALEPPSLLTMLKSGVVLFLYHYEIIV